MVCTAQPSHLEMPQLTALQSTDDNDYDDDDDDDEYISVREMWLRVDCFPKMVLLGHKQIQRKYKSPQPNLKEFRYVHSICSYSCYE